MNTKSIYISYQRVLIVSIILLSAFITKAQHPIYEKFGIDSLKYMVGEISELDSLRFPPYFVYSYNYSHKRSYGGGILISEKKFNKETVIWNYMKDGDFPPHVSTWFDFNGDGKKDLFFLEGYEDEFVTKLYVNNIKDNQDANNNFKVLYKNNNCYATIIDIDGDSKPEIIEGFADGELLSYEISDGVRNEINKEYDRIVGDFDKYNFTYNMPKIYKQFNLFLLSKFKILKIKNSEVVDVTRNYKKHLLWRKEILLKVETLNDKTKETINSLVDYVDNVLGTE